MNQQDKIKEELIRKQIEKICHKNLDSVPVYYILSSKEQTKKPDDWPVILFSRKMLLQDVITKLKQKIQQYPFIYIFGKDKLQDIRQAEMSLKQKRKNKSKGHFIENVQKIVNLDQILLSTSLGEIHQRYKDNNNLLVVILSAQQLQQTKKKKKDIKQILFIVVCILFVGFYIYLSSTDRTKTEQIGLSADAQTIQI